MLNVKQAAEQLGISVSLFYALIAAKKIRHERHGLGRGTIRIPPEAIDEYRRGCVVMPPASSQPLKHIQM